MLFSEDLEKVFLFGLVLILFGTIILWGQPTARATITVPCKFASTDVLFGGRVLAICHYEYTPTGPGTESFALQLPGISDIKYAYISLIDVTTPTKTVDISGSLPPESTTTHLVVVPEEAYNIAIYGEIIGKGVDSDYPDQPYIKGGTKDLVCGLDCKYAKDVIIDSPGSFTLEVFSGYHGAGIDYRIYGSYNLPYPSVTISLNDKTLATIPEVTSERTIYFADKITQKNNVIYVKIDGQPNFKIQIHTEQYCQFTGTDWDCIFVKSKYEKGTLAICSRKLKATCDFEGVNLRIPITDLKYKESASGNLKVSVASQQFEVDPSSTEIVLHSLPEGEYVLTVTYNIPYVVPEAVEAAGVCAIDRYKITFAGAPGKEGTAVFTIYNIGDEDILVRIEIPEDIRNYIEIEPSEVVIPAGGSYTFAVKAKLPDYPTVIRSDIHIYGCAPELVGLTIELNTTGLPPIPMPEIVIPSIAASLAFVVLLLARRFLINKVGSNLANILVVVIPISLFIIIRLLLV